MNPVSPLFIKAADINSQYVVYMHASLPKGSLQNTAILTCRHRYVKLPLYSYGELCGNVTQM
jgi:hypothetical protein